jgi:DNA-binding Lrp family transcriptional regulator
MDFVRPVEAVVGGAQGRLLNVLVQITAPLSLRRLASLAGVSPAQASRVMPRLVELGIVDRYEVPPASQFVLARENVAAQLLVALANLHSTALRQIGEAAAAIAPAPVSVIVFGSFARGEADAESDIDVMVASPDDVDEDDDRWSDALDIWRRHVSAATGNRVEMIRPSRAPNPTTVGRVVSPIVSVGGRDSGHQTVWRCRGNRSGRHLQVRRHEAASGLRPP